MFFENFIYGYYIFPLPSFQRPPMFPSLPSLKFMTSPSVGVEFCVYNTRSPFTQLWMSLGLTTQDCITY